MKDWYRSNAKIIHNFDFQKFEVLKSFNTRLQYIYWAFSRYDL